MIFNTNNKKKIKVLLYGLGASAPVIAEAVLKSPALNTLYTAGKNYFFEGRYVQVNLKGAELLDYALKNKIDLFICDSEINISGITSMFQKAGIPSLGITRKWAQLEASKTFGKRFAAQFGIPVPEYKIIENSDELKAALNRFSFPIVIKSDGYSKGLGTFIAHNFDEAVQKYNRLQTLKQIQGGNLNVKEKIIPKVIIEEFIKGEELSYITVWTGAALIPIAAVKDYKKLSGNSDINTAGMGAFYSPDLITPKQKKFIKEYHKKLENALKELKADFTGPVYSGMIFTENKYYILEYNMRFGSTESHVIFSDLKCDFLDFALDLTSGKLKKSPFDFKKKVCCAAVYPKGYPLGFSKAEILFERIDSIKSENPKIKIYFSTGIKKDKDRYILEGDECIHLVCAGKTAAADINAALDKLLDENLLFRRDIGC